MKVLPFTLFMTILVVVGCIRFSANGTIPSYWAVADSGNHRVLIWQYAPNGLSPQASIVLGQPSLTSNSPNNPSIGSQTLNSPEYVFFDGSRFFVVDSGNNRVLIWNEYPAIVSQSADLVLGQADFVSNSVNGGLGATPNSQVLNQPTSIYSNGHQLFVADSGNNRVLIWNSIPIENFQPADAVLGQSSMSGHSAGGGATGFSGIWGIASDGTHLLTSETVNNRILIWNKLPSSTQQPADVAMGWQSLTAIGSITNPSASSFSQVRNMCIDGNHVLAADANNHRVLIWNSIPTSSGKSADVVLGQPDFISHLCEQGAAFPTAGTFCGPGSVGCTGGKIYVSDILNNRVLGWNSYPTVNGQPADVVIGQYDFNSFTNPSGLSVVSFSGPWGFSMNIGVQGVQRVNGY